MQPRAPDTGTAGMERPPFNSVPFRCYTMMPYIHVIGQIMYQIAKSIPFAKIHQMG